jgi:hypothetical protein
MRPRLPLWVSLLQGVAAALTPQDADEEAARTAAMNSGQPWVAYAGGHRLLVVYDPPPEPREEEPG